MRATGYQCSQRVAREPAGVTDPLSYAELFVFRSVLGREAYAGVATTLDLTQLPVNELSYFEARHTGGDQLLSALTGDTLTVLTAVPHWIEAAAPYTTQAFTVDAVATLAGGDAPQVLPGNRIVLPGHTLSENDVGRWVTLSGFATAAFNTRAKILAYEAGVATTTLASTVTQTGGAWAIQRVRIVTAAGGGQERRFFPTIEGPLAWQVTRGATLIGSGSDGYTMRADPSAAAYRDHRVTLVARTQEEAEARFRIDRRRVELLQEEAERLDDTFLLPADYDYPVP